MSNINTHKKDKKKNKNWLLFLSYYILLGHRFDSDKYSKYEYDLLLCDTIQSGK
jgi:hypothetical protein